MPPLMPAPKKSGGASTTMAAGHAGHMKRQVPASGGAFWTFGRAGYVSGIQFFESVWADIGAGSLLGGGKSGGGRGWQDGALSCQDSQSKWPRRRGIGYDFHGIRTVPSSLV